MSDEMENLVRNPAKAILDGGGLSLMMSVRASKSVDTIFALQAAMRMSQQSARSMP